MTAVTHLSFGWHRTRDDGMCLLEAAAFVAGEPHSDRPEGVCPVLAAFGRAWNDALDDADRVRVLLPFVERLLGTRSTEDVEQRRVWLAADWMVRTYLPAWLRLTPTLVVHADALSAANPVISPAASRAVRPTLHAAGDAAANARWSLARDARWDARWSAARAAGGAAWDAIRAGAMDAAWDVTDDAWDAAWDAIEAAALLAAETVFAATVAELQASAVDLFTRMIEVAS